MTPERWRQIATIFDAALAHDEAERAAFVATSCGTDAELRREIESMIAAHQNAGRFGDTPLFALQTEVESLLDAQQRAGNFAERPPVDRIGASAAFTPAVNRGAPFGTYQIAECLGAGGMGEVYRARDTRLGRDVAIKVLPAAFVMDQERLSRFEREARLLAALNHPHIGAIYGLENVNGVRALVLELVDGETLANRIARGALSLADALPIARQIAEALEAAHEKGIVHRDLKPANIKITSTGVVKVLDFGLAKAGDGAAPDRSRSPTVTIGATKEGVLLGTAAYMSPEQARGQVVDKRTDIWAFGCVLYEMLTGRQAFPGETTSDHIAAILERDPDWKQLTTSTPPSVHRLLRRCLQKDMKHRLHDIADARIEISDTSDQTTTAAPTRTSRWRLWTASISVLVSGALIGGVILWRVKTPRSVQEGLLAAPAARFAVMLPSDESAAVVRPNEGAALAISPDGRYLAYVGGPRLQLYLRPIDRFDSKPLAMSW
jgi:serine/threonine protein kinase